MNNIFLLKGKYERVASQTKSLFVKFLLLSVLIIPSLSFASTVFFQPDSSGEMTSDSNSRTVSDSQTGITIASTTGSLYATINIKTSATSSLYSGSIYVLNSSNQQCYAHTWTTGEVVLYNDGNYHTATYELPVVNGCGGSLATGWRYAIAFGAPSVGQSKADSSDTNPYITLRDTPTIETGITLLNPTAMNYTGNPVPFSGTYDNTGTYNRVQFDLVFSSSTQIVFPAILLNNVTGSNIPFSSYRTLPYSGPYTVRARLFDSSTGSTTAWTATTSFSLNATTTNPVYLPDSPVSTEECSSLDLLCYGKQFASWLFYNSGTEQALQQFNNFGDQIRYKFPFAYIYDIGDFYNELFDSPLAASSTVAVTIRDNTFTFISASQLNAIPLSSTIRTILGWLLWLMTINFIYHKVRKIHDHTS